MPRGTNSSGNSYTTHSNGSYSYSNANGSSTYNTSSGSFYHGGASAPSGAVASSYTNSNTGNGWSTLKN